MRLHGLKETFHPRRSPQRRVALQVDGHTAVRSLENLPATDSPARVNPRSGEFSTRGSRFHTDLSVSVKALQSAFSTIAERQEWLLDHPPVIKVGGDQELRIDFVNYGGFEFKADGSYISHSVNPW